MIYGLSAFICSAFANHVSEISVINTYTDVEPFV